MHASIAPHYQRFVAWFTCAENRHRFMAFKAKCTRAFTEHPADTGESYLEHLLFTVKMSLRFLYTMVVLIIHGVFPFLLKRAASIQIEKVYGIMKSRIPKSRRDEIDAELDYHV